jgi:hypothetical protein
VRIVAMLTCPGFLTKSSPEAIIKVTIMKGNKYPPEFENELPLFYNITSEKKTVLKLPPVTD